ncbi:YEATS domain-containing protein 4 [Galendromus occidentalis]|uniref:YEATS domain-containing protein 4 n=1 Tax=Galendromus occidentalis TaxID=34638 RepID=A0AAJ6QMK1_9ACAR|nr:YEATS domain-containing protein 4 [Galendromus occidentalis]
MESSGDGFPDKTESTQQAQVISRGIVYGNTARYFGFHREDGHTHEWKLYVRPYIDGQDLSSFIRKVVFVLDPYYAKKEVTEPPYEVQHTGWGEFDLEIKIVFRIRAMRTLTLNHYLRLVEYINHDTGDFIYTNSVRSEHYDEIIFSRPPEKLRLALEVSQDRNDRAMQSRQLGVQSNASEGDGEVRRKLRDDEHTLKRALSLQSIRSARQKVRREIELLKHVICRRQDEILRLTNRIQTHENGA